MTENTFNKNELTQELLTSLLPNGPEIPPHHPLMDDIYGVGPDKPLGYLPLETIRKYGQQSPDSVADFCSQRGLTTRMVPKDGLRIGRDSLYVYDLIALQHFLETNRGILDQSEWSAEPEDFVDNVINIGVSQDEDPDLYALIAWAFKDPRVEFGGTGYDEDRRKISFAVKVLNLLRSRS